MAKDKKGNNLGKGITQRKDGRYWVRVKGIPDAYRNSLKEAQDYLADQRYRQRNGLPLLSGKAAEKAEMTVDEFLEEWLGDELSCNTISPNTARHRRGCYETGIKPVMAKKAIAAVTDEDCRTVISRMCKAKTRNGEPYCYETIRKVYSVMRCLFSAAVQRHKITVSPVPKIQIKEREVDANASRKLVISEEECARLFKALRRSSYLYQIMLASETGMRPGELAALRYSDIDFDHGIINVERNFQYGRVYGADGRKCDWFLQPPKTKNGIRKIPMTDKCRGILKDIFEFRQYCPKPEKPLFEDLMFLTRNGTPVPSRCINEVLEKACAQAGVERITMYTFRHNFATRCYLAGVDDLTVQKIMGHAPGSAVTHQTYTHPDGEHYMKEIGKLNTTK